MGYWYCIRKSPYLNNCDANKDELQQGARCLWSCSPFYFSRSTPLYYNTAPFIKRVNDKIHLVREEDSV